MACDILHTTDDASRRPQLSAILFVEYHNHVCLMQEGLGGGVGVERLQV